MFSIFCLKGHNIVIFAFHEERTQSKYGLESRLYGTTLKEWILRRVSGIPCRIYEGGWHHHQLGKGERDWNWDHRTHWLLLVHRKSIKCQYRPCISKRSATVFEFVSCVNGNLWICKPFSAHVWGRSMSQIHTPSQRLVIKPRGLWPVDEIWWNFYFCNLQAGPLLWRANIRKTTMKSSKTSSIFLTNQKTFLVHISISQTPKISVNFYY